MDRIERLLSLAKVYEKELPPPPSLPQPLQGIALAAYIDHTLLKPEASAAQVTQLCTEAKQYHFKATCVNPFYLPLTVELLKGSEVIPCSVLGFPLGAALPAIKAAEAVAHLANGAREIDMVTNVGAIKNKSYDFVYHEIVGVVQIAHSQGAAVKVIIETCLLTQSEKIIASLIVKEAGADFVKTSSGMSSGGATVEDVDLMVRVVGGEIGVKAAGGIRTYADMLAMLHAGATRIGSSAGIKIIQEAIDG